MGTQKSKRNVIKGLARHLMAPRRARHVAKRRPGHSARGRANQTVGGKKRISLRNIHVRARPGRPAQGLLFAGALTLRVALGRGGVRADKREGDGGTPRGCFRPMRLWWRADRLKRPRAFLPTRRIGPLDAWCEDPADRRYNRAFRRSANEPGDRLMRADRLYDLIIEIDHNTRPRVAGRGSAVFIHVARDGLAPTAGCIALRRHDLKILVARLTRETRIEIRL
jgi:L,D-peptidoglycan transpeptidase YkuD (ErfK/YbiS/YcfS/YnhG family)